MNSSHPDVKGPFIVWTNLGCEGWSPWSYASLKEALEANRYSDFVVTKVVEYDVIEKKDG